MPRVVDVGHCGVLLRSLAFKSKCLCNTHRETGFLFLEWDVLAGCSWRPRVDHSGTYSPIMFWPTLLKGPASGG